MHFYLINSKSIVVNEFNAIDALTARVQMVSWCRTNMMRVTLAVALRTGAPSAPVPPPTVDDQPA